MSVSWSFWPAAILTIAVSAGLKKLAIHLGDRAWELYGGWSGAHGESRPFYLLKWRSLMAMQQRGVVRYDMWGLSEHEGDELPIHLLYPGGRYPPPKLRAFLDFTTPLLRRRCEAIVRSIES